MKIEAGIYYRITSADLDEGTVWVALLCTTDEYGEGQHQATITHAIDPGHGRTRFGGQTHYIVVTDDELSEVPQEIRETYQVPHHAPWFDPTAA